MITHDDRRRNVDHKSRMILRRARYRNTPVGFTPVPNKRIDAAIEAATLALTVGYQQQADKCGTLVPSAREIRAEAVRAVAAKLPPARRYG